MSTFKLSSKGKNSSLQISGIAYTSVQSNISEWESCKTAEFRRESLKLVSVKIRAINKHPINILGAFEATFSGRSSSNEVVGSTGIVYVKNSVGGSSQRWFTTQ